MMSEMARVEFGLPITSFKIVQFASNERFALGNLEGSPKVIASTSVNQLDGAKS